MQNSGEGKKCVHHDDVDEAIDAASVVAGDGTDDEAEGERRANDTTADEHRNARAINQAGKDVAAKFVSAAPVGGRRTLETIGEVDVGGILRREPGSEQGEDQEDGDENDSGCCQRIVAGEAGERDGESGHEAILNRRC